MLRVLFIILLLRNYKNITYMIGDETGSITQELQKKRKNKG